jgi:hypothetical protein
MRNPELNTILPNSHIPIDRIPTIPANKKTSIQIILSVESIALFLNRCMIKKIRRPIESMLMPNPRIKSGANVLNYFLRSGFIFIPLKKSMKHTEDHK